MLILQIAAGVILGGIGLFLLYRLVQWRAGAIWRRRMAKPKKD